MDDPTLLRDYVEHRSADAFARLVERYVNLVYSAAVRQVGRREMAQDVTQAVFIALSRRALDAALRRRGVVLSVWLLTATRYACIDALKRESRRARHEQRAATMRSEIQSPSAESESTWEDVRPVLDEALLALSEKDRRAVALRYFQGRSFDEVGAALGATREAAKQRVFRAIERLRAKLLGKGVTVSAVALGSMIGANAVEAAPLGLAAACGSAATASAAATAPAHVANAIVHAITWTKAKLAMSALVTVTVIGGSGAVTAMAVRAMQAPPINRPTQKVPAIAVVQPEAPDHWFAVVEKTYGLKQGQTVKLVPPPYIKERWNWWKSQQPGIRDLKPGEQMFEKAFVMAFADNIFKWEMASVIDCDADTALRHIAKLKAWEVVGPEKLKKAPIPGDWVYRKPSATLDRVAGIEAIVRETLKMKVTIRPVTRKMDVVVVRGQLQLKTPVDQRGRHIIEVGLGEKIQAAPGAPSAYGGPYSASLKDVFNEAEDLLNMRIDDETDWGRSRVMMQRFVGQYKSKPEARQRFLGRLMEQTGLELEVQQRDVDVWEIAEEK